LRVIHVNLTDFQGGAAKVAWTLMDRMNAEGHDVRIFAHDKSSNDSRVIPIPFFNIEWQQELFKQQSERGLFDLYSAALLRVLGDPLFAQADIVHLHCIYGGYFSFLLLPFLTAKPTVWTLHDSLAFTAGCLNTDLCSAWKDDLCAGCPMDKSDGKNPPQRVLMQSIKESIYKIVKFTAVCPSVWLEKQAKESIMKDQAIMMIHNGIDVEVFHPGNRGKLRAKLGLPINKKIIMSAAYGGLNNPFKGVSLLIDALKKLHDDYKDIILLNIGTYDNSVLEGLPTERIDIPFIYDSQLLSEYYAAADIFVSASTVENLSLTVCEASACGTPVVAFAVGGTPEIVVHQETGYIAKQGCSDDLACGIRYFLDDDYIRQCAGEAARKRIMDKFNARHMADEYMNLYQKMLNT